MSIYLLINRQASRSNDERSHRLLLKLFYRRRHVPVCESEFKFVHILINLIPNPKLSVILYPRIKIEVQPY